MTIVSAVIEADAGSTSEERDGFVAAAEKMGLTAVPIESFGIDEIVPKEKQVKWLKDAVLRAWKIRSIDKVDPMPSFAFIFCEDHTDVVYTARLFTRDGPGAVGARTVIRKVVESRKANGAAFISESWGVSIPAGKLRSDYPARFSDYTGPDRRECVHLCYEARGEKPRIFMADILRGVDGPELGEWTEPAPDGEVSGLAVGFF